MLWQLLVVGRAAGSDPRRDIFPPRKKNWLGEGRMRLTSAIVSDSPERLPDESAAAYARFLAYRNLGPARTLDAAYRAFRGVPEGSKRCRRPGQWQRESVQFNWAARALAALALKATKPNGWAEALEALKILGAFVPHEVIQAVSKAQGG
jgi:hypothetical protein